MYDLRKAHKKGQVRQKIDFDTHIKLLMIMMITILT